MKTKTLFILIFFLIGGLFDHSSCVKLNLEAKAMVNSKVSAMVKNKAKATSTSKAQITSKVKTQAMVQSKAQTTIQSKAKTQVKSKTKTQLETEAKSQSEYSSRTWNKNKSKMKVKTEVVEDLLSFFENNFDFFNEMAINGDSAKAGKTSNKYLNTLNVKNEMTTDSLKTTNLNSTTAELPVLKFETLDTPVLAINSEDNSITLKKSPLLQGSSSSGQDKSEEYPFLGLLKRISEIKDFHNIIQNIAKNNKEIFFDEYAQKNAEFMKDNVMISVDNDNDDNNAGGKDELKMTRSKHSIKNQAEREDNVMISISKDEDNEQPYISKDNVRGKYKSSTYESHMGRNSQNKPKDIKDLISKFNKELIKDKMTMEKANRILN